MQFADDMLILMEGEEHNVLVLKSLSKWLWRYPVEHQSLSAAVLGASLGMNLIFGMLSRTLISRTVAPGKIFLKYYLLSFH